MNTAESQELLGHALAILHNHPDKDKPELSAATFMFDTILDFSRSGNGIPSLRGKGLEEAHNLARAILRYGVGAIRIDTKALAQSTVPRTY